MLITLSFYAFNMTYLLTYSAVVEPPFTSSELAVTLTSSELAVTLTSTELAVTLTLSELAVTLTSSELAVTLTSLPKDGSTSKPTAVDEDTQNFYWIDKLLCIEPVNKPSPYEHVCFFDVHKTFLDRFCAQNQRFPEVYHKNATIPEKLMKISQNFSPATISANPSTVFMFSAPSCVTDFQMFSK